MRLSRWSLPRRLFQGPAYEGVGGALSREADEEKVSLRMQTYSLWPQHTVLDLYAGKGYLSWLYARHGCKKIVCVEKDERYFRVLKQNMAEFKGKAVLMQGSNLEFLENQLDPDEQVTYVDFDAFGVPTIQIQKFFEKYPIRHSLVMAVTDGVIFNFRRLSNTDLHRYYLQDFLIEQVRACKSIQDLGEYCIQIQRQFIDILCMKHEAQAFPLYFKVNRRCTAIYSAYMILPKIVGVVDFKRYVGLKGSPLETQKILKQKIVKIGV